MFAGTNVDDLVVLTVLFLSARATGRPRPWQIWSGQYAGIAVLVVVSALAALGLAAVPDRWVGLLGLVPIALGVKGLVTTIRQPLTDLYQDRLRGYPLRPRRTFTDRVARQIGEHLPTLVIEAQRPRSTVEPDILQIRNSVCTVADRGAAGLWTTSPF